MGGSQGGHNVNMAVVGCLTGGEVKIGGWQVLHLTGNKDKIYAEEKYQEASISSKVLEFTEEMNLVLAAAELVICRAGASSLAELAAAGTPSILLPYPYHKDQHQMRNAEVLAEAGAAKVVVDTCKAEITAKCLSNELRKCMEQDKLSKMSQAAHNLARPGAARAVAEELRRLAGTCCGKVAARLYEISC
jgi:UDP-N-acetylglucosamine--N-acetylmuramyl-(pentapeptide) pyrophosphoryl-undecaprenol N-acetylglucosamine transferase